MSNNIELLSNQLFNKKKFFYIYNIIKNTNNIILVVNIILNIIYIWVLICFKRLM